MKSQIARYIVMLLVLMEAGGPVLAQKLSASEKELRGKAEQCMKKEDYACAAAAYSQLLSLQPDLPEFNYGYGVSLFLCGKDKAKAAQYLEVASRNPKVNNDVFFYLGRSYSYANRFDDALKAFETFRKQAGSGRAEKYDTEKYMAGCRNAKDLAGKPKDVSVVSSQQLILYGFYSVYDYTQVDGKILSTPAQFLSSTDKEKMNDPAMNLAGNEIYFASYGKNSAAGKDLFRATRQSDGSWGKPQNLGTVVNSDANEDYPFWDKRTHTLYFASKGHNSIGGYDIFKSTYDAGSGQWSQPENIGLPINTPDDDILYIPNATGSFATYATNVASDKARIEVRKIQVHESVQNLVTIHGTFFPGDMAFRKDAKIRVREGEKGFIASVQTNERTGTYELSLTPGKEYELIVDAGGYTTHTEKFTITEGKGAGEWKQEIRMDRRDGRESMTLNSYFLQAPKNAAPVAVDAGNQPKEEVAASKGSAQETARVAQSETQPSENGMTEKQLQARSEVPVSENAAANVTQDNAAKTPVAGLTLTKNENSSVTDKSSMPGSSANSAGPGYAQEQSALTNEGTNTAGSVPAKTQTRQDNTTALTNAPASASSQVQRTSGSTSDDGTTVRNQIVASQLPLPSYGTYGSQAAEKEAQEKAVRTESVHYDSLATAQLKTARATILEGNPENIGLAKSIFRESLRNKKLADSTKAQANSLKMEAASLREKEAQSQQSANANVAGNNAPDNTQVSSTSQTPASNNNSASELAITNTNTAGQNPAGNTKLSEGEVQTRQTANTVVAGNNAPVQTQASSKSQAPGSNNNFVSELAETNTNAAGEKPAVNTNSTNVQRTNATEGNSLLIPKTMMQSSSGASTPVGVSTSTESPANVSANPVSENQNAGQTVSNPGKANETKVAIINKRAGIKTGNQESASTTSSPVKEETIHSEVAANPLSAEGNDQAASSSDEQAAPGSVTSVSNTAKPAQVADNVMPAKGESNSESTTPGRSSTGNVNENAIVNPVADQDPSSANSTSPSTTTSASAALEQKQQQDAEIAQAMEQLQPETREAMQQYRNNMQSSTELDQQAGDLVKKISAMKPSPERDQQMVKANDMYHQSIVQWQQAQKDLSHARELDTTLDEKMPPSVFAYGGEEQLTTTSPAEHKAQTWDSTSTSFQEYKAVKEKIQAGKTETIRSFAEALGLGQQAEASYAEEASIREKAQAETDSARKQTLLADAYRVKLHADSIQRESESRMNVARLHRAGVKEQTRQSHQLENQMSDPKLYAQANPSAETAGFSVPVRGSSNRYGRPATVTAAKVTKDHGMDVKNNDESVHTGTEASASSAGESTSATMPVAATTVETNTQITSCFRTNSSSTANSSVPMNPVLPGGLIFKVQVGAFRTPIPAALFKGIEPVSGETSRAGWIRYCVGIFQAWESATTARDEMRKAGFRDAFVVAYFNGQRISMADAYAHIRGMQDDGKQAYATARKSESESLSKIVSSAINVAATNVNTASGTLDAAGTNLFEPVQPGTATPAASESIEFAVQVGVFRNVKAPASLASLQPLHTEQAAPKKIRFLMPQSTDWDRAEAMRKQAVIAGVHDAFIVVYKNGQRLPGSAAAAYRKTPTESPAMATKAVTSDTMSYKVQIGAFRESVPVSVMQAFISLGTTAITQDSDSGLVTFYAGQFSEYSDALKLREEIAGKGIPDAFVVAFRNGRKIPSTAANQYVH